MRASRFDRRLLPRPLPAHLLSATLLWLSSRAGLTSLASGLPLSNMPPGEAAARLQALASEIARHGAEPVGAGLDREVRRRAERFVSGLETYRRHPYRRPASRAPTVWRHGAARLLDYGHRRATEAPAILLVPSLINRWYILDLLPERSFVRHLARNGLRPLVLDWGDPAESEGAYGLADYITGPLAGALDAAAALAGRPVAVLGYCMGGTLALALALRRPAATACLALLAAPWDFHAEQREQTQLLAALIDWLPLLIDDAAPVPVSVIQGLFAALDPFLAERKFVAFAGLDPASAAARGFVALEDWLNDGVPLARRVALECAHSWYRDNDPPQDRWQIAGRPVRPQEFNRPTLVVLPSRDRIVPPRSAAALAAAIPGAELLRPALGHIGMMSSAQAPAAVWQPITEWFQARLYS